MTPPDVRDLLSPLTEDVEPTSRRFQVDREKIVSRMVEVSLTPEARFSPRVRLGMALALAASFALAAWGGLSALQRQRELAAASIEVLALRGQVTSAEGSLQVGQARVVSRDGTLETSAHAEARIQTGGGMAIDLLENTKVSLRELGVSKSSSALRLERGRVRCVIPHEPGRVFSVVTANARVVDVGTTFSVSVQPAGAGVATIVHVEEGEVMVEHAGTQRHLRAPASWSSAPEAATPAVEPAPAALPAVEEAPAAASPRRDVASSKRQRETLDTETQLLQRGLASEQRGDFQGAARAFEQLVARYPGSPLAPDARAALARVKGRLGSPK